MATGNVILPILGWTGDAANPPGLSWANSRPRLLFDDTTDELCYVTFRMPDNYASAPKLEIAFSMDTDHDNGHDVCFRGAVMAYTDSDAVAIETDSYDTINYVSGAIPDDLGYMIEPTLTLANADGVAAGDYVSIQFGRDADGTGGTDDATGDLEVWHISLTYTTT